MVEEFFKQVGPALFANIMTVMLIYGFWRHKHAEDKRDEIAGLLSILIVGGFMLGSLYYWGFMDEKPKNTTVLSETGEVIGGTTKSGIKWRIIN